MKFSRLIFSCAILFNATQAFAAIEDGFFFKPFATIEYSAPKLSGGGDNNNFKTNTIFKQLTNFENIALGLHSRIHQYVGLNLNWSQTDLSSNVLVNYSLSKKAKYALDYYNFSVQLFAPTLGDTNFEAFAEIGVSDMQSKLSIFESNGSYTKRNAHETQGFAGFGFQYAPFESSDDAFRLSFLRYFGKIALLDTNLALVRLGYIKSF